MIKKPLEPPHLKQFIVYLSVLLIIIGVASYNIIYHVNKMDYDVTKYPTI